MIFCVWVDILFRIFLKLSIVINLFVINLVVIKELVGIVLFYGIFIKNVIGVNI